MVTKQNLSEEANMLITLFDAGNPKYGIREHFGLDISGLDNYRSIHIAEARDVPNPTHLHT